MSGPSGRWRDRRTQEHYPSGPGGSWNDLEAKRRYMREWHRENWPRLRAMSSARVQAWRARKARQAVKIDEFLSAFGEFDYARKCEEVSRDSRRRG